MAAVEVTITGMLYDKLARTAQNVVLIGEATLTGLGVGGGPMPPGPGKPPGIWGGSNEPFPTPPIANVPGVPGYRPPGTIWPDPPEGIAPHPEHPIVIPPNVPPGLQPPTPPKPGDPTTPVPPPAGSPGWPVQPIAVPPYVVINYPGLGPVVVAPPATPT